MTREITYNESILEGLYQKMLDDEKIIVIGEGVPDPKGIFGTTLNLQKRFPKRVFDSPLSENAVTGICAGLAINGFRPILIHQRVDFSLLSMDQIVNNIAKWQFMFNKRQRMPVIIRMIIGRGWGQGPQHSQSLHNLFASIPGLQVVMPTSPKDVKGMLISALEQNNPTIFIEHRWLQNIKEHVPNKIYRTSLSTAKILKKGKDFTIATTSYMTIEALKAIKALNILGINCELIDIRSVSPIDYKTVINSVKKTKGLVVADIGHSFMNIANELIYNVNETLFDVLETPCKKIALPNYPAATSHLMMKNYYKNSNDLFKYILKVKNFKLSNIDKKTRYNINEILDLTSKPHDVPSVDFFGPF